MSEQYYESLEWLDALEIGLNVPDYTDSETDSE